MANSSAKAVRLCDIRKVPLWYSSGVSIESVRVELLPDARLEFLPYPAAWGRDRKSKKENNRP